MISTLLNIIRFLIKHLDKRLKISYIVLIFLSILIGCSDLLSIYFLKSINTGFSLNSSLDHKYTIFFMINFLALFLIKLIYLIINRYVLLAAEEGICNQLIKKHFSNVYIDDKKISDSSIVNLITYESKRLSLNVIKPINLIISSLMMLIILTSALILFGYSSTLFIAGFGCLLLFVVFLLIKKKFDYFNKNLTYKNNSRTKNILDFLNGTISIKTLALEKYFNNEFIKFNHQLKRISFLSELYQQLPIKFVELFVIILIFLAYLINYLYPDSSFIRIDFFVYFYAFYRAYPMIKDIYSAFTNLQNNTEAFFQIKKYLDFKNEEKFKKLDGLFNFQNIEFKNISIIRDDKTILKDINIKITNDSFLGILGKSGTGKTSLALSIAGLIRIQNGQFQIDNNIFETSNIYKFRKQIIYLSEDPFIITGSVEKNLLNENYDKKEFLKLCEIVNYKELKLDEFIDSDNENISYGQRQKIALIRALLFKPKILILDEALNGIDILTMNEIFSFLRKIKISVILITHNSSVLTKNSDQIINLD